MATGQDLIRKAAARLGDAYVLGVLAPKDNAAWRGPWDCAEFVSWCVYQVSGRLYGCDNNRGNPARADAYTGFWQRDAASLGRIVSVAIAAQTPGAAVLRYPQQNLIGHIVFSDGNGGTIEAHSSRTGVICSTLSSRRWDTGVLVPGIEFTQAAGAVVVSAPLVTLRLTDPLTRGTLVKSLQRRLKAEGFSPGPIDGLYGPQTVAAVNAFQIVNGLVPDGEVGPETARALGIEFPQ
jgi:N-acetylmuramoyl-L-alanine amidase